MKTIGLFVIQFDLTKTNVGNFPKDGKVLGQRFLKDPENPPPNAILNLIVEHDVDAELIPRKFLVVKIGAVLPKSGVFIGQIGPQDYLYDVSAPA